MPQKTPGVDILKELSLCPLADSLQIVDLPLLKASLDIILVLLI
jgi:hypothetical protein